MARALARTVTQPGTCGRQEASVAVVLLAALAVSLSPAAAQTVDEPGSYKGRKIADVMSFRGAGWLERATRIEEENPDALIAALPIEKGMLVVDIGCGSGYYARRLAVEVGPEGMVLCNDIQPQMLRIASELAAREGITNISTVLGTEDDPKLPEGDVDLMLIVDVYHEFSQPEPMLHAMREALAPDGVGLQAAIILHRAPIGLLIWWMVRPRHGRTGGSIGLAALGVATLAGYGIGMQLVEQFESSIILYQAYVGGTLMHFVFHQGRHGRRPPHPPGP